ncbi:MAG: hypothetical protein GX868_12855 [Actinobacteria bacterium]|nr:hypothetical protein [Actinomycetota bacterium]
MARALAAVGGKEAAAASADHACGDAERRWHNADADAAAARGEAETMRAEVDALRAALGSDAQSVFDEVRRLDAESQRLRAQIHSLEKSVNDTEKVQAKVSGQLESSEMLISAAEQHLASVAGRLGVLRNGQLLSVLDLDDADSHTDAPGLAIGLPTDPVDFARWLAQRVPGDHDEADHKKVSSAFDAAYKTFYNELHYEYAPDLTRTDDLSLVEVTVEDAHRVGPAELVERLDAQARRMEEQLTESDRELFERHLLQSVASELRRLLSEADDFVANVNGALSKTATASGLRVELKWAVRENTAEVRRALSLLRTDTDMFGADEREALREFFNSAIQAERAQNPEAGYRANLENVVDYRKWHRFEPHLIGPDGRARLTKEKFRSLSGGEQSVALHLPLFAAAAAHYNRAADDAPRLIALDEAFAGIDETLRGELMGLTVAFDLDVVLTGHELWGAYREVPHIAAYDLMRSPDFPGVNVMSFRWDGQSLTEHADERVEPALGGLFEGSA